MKLNENTCIYGRNVILVPYRQHHVLKYHQWMKSPELQHLTASEPLSLEEEYEMQKSWHLDEKKCTFIVLDKAIYDEKADEISAMIGDTNLFFSSHDLNDEAEIEIMIAEENARGKKRGWEAVLLMLKYGSEVVGVKRFVVKIGIDNTRSIHMFKKIGFNEVSRSDVFSEVTMDLQVTLQWKEWIRSATEGVQTVHHYNETFKQLNTEEKMAS